MRRQSTEVVDQHDTAGRDSLHHEFLRLLTMFGDEIIHHLLPVKKRLLVPILEKRAMMNLSCRFHTRLTFIRTQPTAAIFSNSSSPRSSIILTNPSIWTSDGNSRVVWLTSFECMGGPAMW